MTHYVCTGTCRGVAEHPGVCQDESCPKRGHNLVACECEDGKHKDVFEKADKEAEEEKPKE